MTINNEIGKLQENVQKFKKLWFLNYKPFQIKIPHVAILSDKIEYKQHILQLLSKKRNCFLECDGMDVDRPIAYQLQTRNNECFTTRFKGTERTYYNDESDDKIKAEFQEFIKSDIEKKETAKFIISSSNVINTILLDFPCKMSKVRPGMFSVLDKDDTLFLVLIENESVIPTSKVAKLVWSIDPKSDRTIFVIMSGRSSQSSHQLHLENKQRLNDSQTSFMYYSKNLKEKLEKRIITHTKSFIRKHHFDVRNVSSGLEKNLETLKGALNLTVEETFPLLVKMINTIVENFQKAIHVGVLTTDSDKTISHTGSEISKIIHSQFKRKISELSEPEHLRERIIKLLENENITSPLYVPAKVFHRIVEEQLRNYLTPSLDCMRLAVEKLRQLTDYCCNDPKIIESVRKSVKETIIYKLNDQRKEYEDFITLMNDCERGYINVKHVDFKNSYAEGLPEYVDPKSKPGAMLNESDYDIVKMGRVTIENLFMSKLQKKWLILTKTKLLIFKNKTRTELLCPINLDDLEIANSSGLLLRDKHGLKIMDCKHLNLTFSSKEEKDEWFNEIEEQMKLCSMKIKTVTKSMLNKYVDRVLESYESYMKIVDKTVVDFIPKLIVNFIDKLEMFIKQELKCSAGYILKNPTFEIDVRHEIEKVQSLLTLCDSINENINRIISLPD